MRKWWSLVKANGERNRISVKQNQEHLDQWWFAPSMTLNTSGGEVFSKRDAHSALEIFSCCSFPTFVVRVWRYITGSLLLPRWLYTIGVLSQRTLNYNSPEVTAKIAHSLLTRWRGTLQFRHPIVLWNIDPDKQVVCTLASFWRRLSLYASLWIPGYILWLSLALFVVEQKVFQYLKSN